MTRPPRPKATHIDTEVVRDLQIMLVPPEWSSIDNDEQIKARLEQETTMMLLTGPRIMREVNGAWKPRPDVLGIIRDFRVDLVRAGDDVQIEVEHTDCTDCTDAIETLRMAAKEGQMPAEIVGVVQFTYDNVVSIS